MFEDRFPFKRNRDPFEDLFDDIWTYRRGWDIFDEFEEQFRRIQRRMSRLYKEALRSGTIEGKPRIYGWCLRIDSNGKPVFQEFGNIPRLQGSLELPESREPLVDVQETDKQIMVTAEIPGVPKEDIDLEVTSDTLTIRVDSKDRRYYKEINLPAEVDAESGEATYNNGVLTITLNKIKTRRKGKKIKIS